MSSGMVADHVSRHKVKNTMGTLIQSLSGGKNSELLRAKKWVLGFPYNAFGKPVPQHAGLRLEMLAEADKTPYLTLEPSDGIFWRPSTLQLDVDELDRVRTECAYFYERVLRTRSEIRFVPNARTDDISDYILAPPPRMEVSTPSPKSCRSHSSPRPALSPASIFHIGSNSSSSRSSRKSRRVR